MVEQIPIPPAVRAQSALARVDYTDAFRLAGEQATARSAEGWARTMIEGAPAAMRHSLRRGWWALGLRLGSTEGPQRVLGWRIRRSDPDHAVLAAESRLGMRAELLFDRAPDGVLFATVINLRNPVARAVWAVTPPRHQRVVRHLLTQAERRGCPRLRPTGR